MNARLDKDVIRACKKGDKAAYAVLVKRYYKGVFGLCLGMLGNIHDAEDTTQEAILRGLLRIKKLHKPALFESWILQIARNLCIDSIRRQKRTRPDGEKEPGQYHSRTSNDHDLAWAIKRLPQELRVPLTMFYFDGKNAKTIAEKLNISHSGACRRIRMARQQLHELLAERTYDE